MDYGKGATLTTGSLDEALLPKASGDDKQDDVVEKAGEDEQATQLSSGAQAPPEPEIDERPMHCRGAFYGSVAILCSATLGAGVLALPYALAEAGLMVGLLLMGLAAFITIASVDALAEASRVYGKHGYGALVMEMFGKTPAAIVQGAMMVYCMGTAVAYVVAVKDILMQAHLSFLSKWPPSLPVIVVWAAAMLPLSMMRRIESLQWASATGVTSIGILILASIVHFLFPPGSHHHGFSPHPHPDGDGDSPSNWDDILLPNKGIISIIQAAPLVMFAFSCQINVPQIVHELPPGITMERVTRASVGLCTFLYTTIAVVALLDFGRRVAPNVLLNYNPQSMWILEVAFVAMAFTVVVAFSLVIFPSRIAVFRMIAPRDDDDQEEVQQEQQHEQQEQQDAVEEAPALGGGSDPHTSSLQEPLLPSHDLNELQSIASMHTVPDVGPQEAPFWQHVLVTLALTTSALGLALVVPNISVVFGFVGGSVASILGFIVPGFLGLSLAEKRQDEPHKIRLWKLLIGGGVVIGVLTTGVTIGGAVL